MARDVNNKKCIDYFSIDAVKFCAMGAFSREAEDMLDYVQYMDATETLRFTVKQMRKKHIVLRLLLITTPQSLNDLMGHKMVLKMYDEAIKIVKNRQGFLTKKKGCNNV